ncbi:MAG: hypothetical protein FWG30_00720 [Eubacteriaceae bacterium]|nr:hypothetical protein [Eubacteriaceae bacterium]
MGAGIFAAIPIVFEPAKHNGLDENNFSSGFFDNYNAGEIESKRVYTIKKDLLIYNYIAFLHEFYGLIGEDFYKNTQLALDSIPDVTDFDEFMRVFNRNIRGGWIPYVYEVPYAFSVCGCLCNVYWMFYSGSYKADLEEYSTLVHFERILAKGMNNPLSNAVKFGIFG